MKRTTFILSIICLFFCLSFTSKDSSDEIILLVRGDDMGFSHSANLAFVDAYQKGIMRSAEIMVVCPWFPEAVKLCKENPGLDIGIHLALTSEWSAYKWRPLTNAPSITDEDGYFYPMYWANDRFPEERTFRGADWKIEEVEKELRAQVELAVKHLPNISHMGIHMGGESVDPRIKEVCDKLRKEFKLTANPSAHGFERCRPFGENSSKLTPEQKTENMIKFLENLEPGKYIQIDHPAYNTPEMSSIMHKGYENVAIDRDGVIKAWTDPKVLEVIKKRGIKLVSYADCR